MFNFPVCNFENKFFHLLCSSVGRAFRSAVRIVGSCHSYFCKSLLFIRKLVYDVLRGYVYHEYMN